LWQIHLYFYFINVYDPLLPAYIQSIETGGSQKFFEGGGDNAVVWVLAEFLEGVAGAGMIEFSECQGNLTTFSPIWLGGEFNETFHDCGLLRAFVETTHGIDAGFLDGLVGAVETFEADFQEFDRAFHITNGGEDTPAQKPMVVLDEGGGEVGEGDATEEGEGVGGFGPDAGGVVKFHHFQQGLEAAIGLVFGEGHGDEGSDEEFAIGKLVDEDWDGDFGGLVMEGLDGF
jgi:hypothetical protein